MEEQRKTNRRVSDDCQFHVDHENRIKKNEDRWEAVIDLLNKAQRYIIVTLLCVIATLLLAYGKWAAEKIDPPTAQAVEMYQSKK